MNSNNIKKIEMEETHYLQNENSEETIGGMSRDKVESKWIFMYIIM